MRRVWTLSGAADDRTGERTGIRSPAFISPNLLKSVAGICALTAIAILPARAGHAQDASQVAEVERVTRTEAELANACIRSGKPKAECICVARILRVSVHPYDYAPSAKLQTASYADRPSAVSATKATLIRGGWSEPELVALDRRRRDVMLKRVDPACARLGATTPS